MCTQVTHSVPRQPWPHRPRSGLAPGAELRPFTRLAPRRRTSPPIWKGCRPCRCAAAAAVHAGRPQAGWNATNLQRVCTSSTLSGGKFKDRQQTPTHQRGSDIPRLNSVGLKCVSVSRLRLVLCLVLEDLWVTYCFSWASRSLTSASRLLTSMTSSSSSSCSRLFWASVFCQSAKTAQEQTSSEQETPRTNCFYSNNLETLCPLDEKLYVLVLPGTCD